MFLAHVVVETNGAIPNRDAHVRGPLARIVAQAFAYAIKPTKRITPESVSVEFCEDARLKRDTLAAIYISSNADDRQVTDIGELRKMIESSIHQSAMFKCRSTPGAVEIKLCLGAHLATAEA